MQQFVSVWQNLDNRRRIVIVFATLLMFLAVFGLSRVASKPSKSLLYSGMEPSASGEVIQALEAQGVDYDVRGGAIFVPSNMRDQLRMTLASQGLPANSSGGYELLDSLSGFGTTSQMFDAAYWRAKEGEIARTIVSSGNAKAARVHIANPSSQPFRRQVTATASVLVTTQSGDLSSDQANAYKFLVASAVAGLSPDDVSVIDARSGVVVADESSAAAASGADKANDLREKLQRLLEARVGAGKAVVEVSVEAQTDIESIVERQFDPDSRVAISSEIEERNNTAADSRGGNVTVASNLPDGDGASGGDSNSSNSETRERINYEVSETRREIQRGPGAIKRLTVAILVDGIREVDEANQTEVWQARGDQELQDLRELVAAAIGYNEARGDQITIKSMEFEPVSIQGTGVESSIISGLSIDLMTFIQLAVLAFVSLVLGLFVLRPIFTKALTAPPPALPQELMVANNADQRGVQNDEQQMSRLPSDPSQAMNAPVLAGEIESPNLAGMDLPASYNATEDPVLRLKKLIEERQDETVEILRGWMDDRAGEAR